MNLNFPLPAEMNIDRYRGYLDRALQRIRDFSPHYLVVSMGFDTYHTEILGDARFETGDYRMLGSEIRAAGFPVLACLEGGYDLDALGANVVSFIHGLTG
jgi:acetoin utilization deacetylase AcuC-like enzyme